MDSVATSGAESSSRLWSWRRVLSQSVSPSGGGLWDFPEPIGVYMGNGDFCVGRKQNSDKETATEHSKGDGGNNTRFGPVVIYSASPSPRRDEDISATRARQLHFVILTILDIAFGGLAFIDYILSTTAQTLKAIYLLILWILLVFLVVWGCRFSRPSHLVTFFILRLCLIIICVVDSPVDVVDLYLFQQLIGFGEVVLVLFQISERGDKWVSSGLG